MAAPGGLTAPAGQATLALDPPGIRGAVALGRHRAESREDTPVRTLDGRVSRPLVAAGWVCLLGGLTMLAPGPDAVAPPLDAPAVPRVYSGTPVFDGELARLLAGEAPAPEPVLAGTPPVELALPGRGLQAPVVAVTTGPEGALVVPEPPSTVGWWSPSALAGGAGGTTVLAGHVDSLTGGLGALAVLRHVTEGEEVVLRGADGRSVGYRVTARRQYAKAELPPEVFAAGGPPRLVLITCGGLFDRRTRHYADNVVVFAEPV